MKMNIFYKKRKIISCFLRKMTKNRKKKYNNCNIFQKCFFIEQKKHAYYSYKQSKMKSLQKDYSKDKANFSLISGLYHQIKQTFYITLFVTPVFWIYSKSLAAKFGFEGEYWDTVFFLLVTSTFELIIGKIVSKSIKVLKVF